MWYTVITGWKRGNVHDNQETILCEWSDAIEWFRRDVLVYFWDSSQQRNVNMSDFCKISKDMFFQ